MHKCQQIEFVQKSGIVRGKQRYFCKSCDYHFTLSEPPNHTEGKRHHQVTIMNIANQLGISKSIVSCTLRRYTEYSRRYAQNVMDIEHTRHRKTTNAVTHLLAAICAYSFTKAPQLILQGSIAPMPA